MDGNAKINHNRVEVKKLKKVIAFFIVLVVFAGGSWFAYNYFYGGDTYYVKVVDEGVKGSDTDDNTGEVYTKYTYDQKAYDEDGESKEVTMTEHRDKPLRLNAYLKLVVNARKGVIKWEEVQQNDVPDKALAKLDQ